MYNCGSPCDVIIGHLQLGEEDGAVLGSPAVYHRYYLVSPGEKHK